jgi:glyoxylase-like metal-dependent hydrolase (beta-lactamase superfamily II)
MTVSRRDFTRLFATAAAAGLTLPRSLTAMAARRQATLFTWQQHGPRIRVAMGQGGNVVLFQGSGEALLIDSKNPGYGFTLKREADAFGTPVRWFLNTHHHADHVGGNAVFADVPMIAHPTATERIRTWAAGLVGKDQAAITNAITQQRTANASPAVIADLERAQEQFRTITADRFVPARAARDGEELRIGGRTVILRHIGPGHTDNDVFVFFPEENVLHTGDLLFNNQHGFMDQMGGVSSTGWQKSLQAIQGMVKPDTVVIPGHGSVGTPALLQRQYDYFSQLRDAVSAAIREGKTKEEVTALRPAAVADIMGNPSRNLGVVYDEVKGAA